MRSKLATRSCSDIYPRRLIGLAPLGVLPVMSRPAHQARHGHRARRSRDAVPPGVLAPRGGRDYHAPGPPADPNRTRNFRHYSRRFQLATGFFPWERENPSLGAAAHLMAEIPRSNGG